MSIPDFVTRLTMTPALLDASGHMVEAGFAAMRDACFDATTPIVELRAHRIAFMVGALHMFHLLDADPRGDGDGDAYAAFVARISAELEAFSAELKIIRHAAGNA